jgi:hypothetical protein
MSKSFAKGDRTMTTLTERQKLAVSMLCMYEADAALELRTEGVTERYDSYMWMVVYYKKELGLKVHKLEQKAADRDEAREAA